MAICATYTFPYETASMPRSFLRTSLPLAANLADGRPRRGLRRLAARVGIHARVEHQYVDVAIRRQHVVEAAEADVIGPAVAADDPHAAPHKRIGHAGQLARLRLVDLGKPLLQPGHALALLADRRPRSFDPPRAIACASPLPILSRQLLEQVFGIVALPDRPPAECQARTRRCPRTASCTRPGRSRCLFVVHGVVGKLPP